MSAVPSGAPFTRILVLDFETAWDKENYSLSKMTTEAYLRDPRFKAWGCAYQWEDDPNGRPKWVSAKDLPAFFNSINWAQTAVMSHNAMFDVAILAWHYGHKPAFIFDTLSMSRAVLGVEESHSLASLALRFCLPPKGEAVYSTNGYLNSLPPEIEAELSGYCEHDAALCLAIYDRLQQLLPFPTKELRLIDATIRMFVEPVLQLDKELLVEAIHDEKTRREALLHTLAVTEPQLASNEQFAKILTNMGIDPPMKISKLTNKPTYAFAKNDAMFQALLNGDREDVALLCEARMAVKSTLERTRAQRFLDVARRGALPVPLRYYAAHTGRWGGSDGINMQNLRRKGALRQAIKAPEGHSLLVVDLAQIEPRVLAWLADFRSMQHEFARGGDPYATFGAQMFGIPGMTKDSHPELRQSAKSALLGCGYGLGWASFAAQLMTGFLGAPPVLYGISFAKQLGISADNVYAFMQEPQWAARMQEIPRVCTNDELALHCYITKVIVDKYRTVARPVVNLWKLYGDYIDHSLVRGKTYSHKCLSFKREEVVLPNGLSLRYPNLQALSAVGIDGWAYGKDRKKLYGGKLTENIVQAVARIVMTDGILRVQKRFPCKMMAHDEGVFVVPDVEVDEAKRWVLERMIVVPKYLLGIQLNATIGVGKSYGEAK